MTTKLVRFMIDGKQKTNSTEDISLIAKLVVYNNEMTNENTIRKLGRNFDQIEKVSVYDENNNLLATATCTQANWHITANKAKANEKKTDHARSQTLNAYAKKSKYKPVANEKITDTMRDFGPDIYSLCNEILTVLEIKSKPVSNAKQTEAKLAELLAQNAALIAELTALKAQSNA